MAFTEDDLMAQALGAVENPNEGKEAYKFITAAPKVGPSAEELKRQAMEKLEKARKAKAADELKAKQAAEEKRQKALELKAKQEAEAKERRAQELKAKQAAEEQSRKEEALKRKQAEELKAKQAAEEKARKEAEEIKAQEAAEQERERKRIEQEISSKRKEKESNAPKNDDLPTFGAKEIKNSIKENPSSSAIFKVENIEKILRVTDMYRDFDQSIKESVQAFYKASDESKVVSRVLTEKNDTRKALEALIFAQDAAQVDRAFYLVSLDVAQLGTMGYILMNYTGNEIELNDIARRRIEYCRQLERIISEMSIPQQNNLQAIQELLAEPMK